MECEEEFRGGGATPRRSSPERNRQRALGMELQEPFAGERRGGGTLGMGQLQLRLGSCSSTTR
jgi:hypothetical protein